jgi:hypothetical protein
MEFQGILLENQKEWNKKIEEKEGEMNKIRKQHEKAEEDIRQMMYVASMLYTEIFHCTSQKDKWIL